MPNSRPRGRTSQRRRLLGLAPAALVLVLALALGACSGGGADSAGDEDGGQDSAAVSAGAPVAEGGGEEAPAGGAVDAATADQASTRIELDRKVVLRADLVVETDAVVEGARRAEGIVTTAGGVVTNEETYIDPGPDADTISTLTLRVPPEAHSTVLDQLAELGTLVSQNRGEEDVTDEYVDVEARIRSQQMSLDRLLSLVTDAADLTDVITLENEIARRQADLDALQARLEALDEQAAMTTITLTLTSSPQAVVVARTGFVGGLQSGWEAFTGSVAFVLMALGAALPFVVVLALLGGAAYVVRNRLRDRRPGVATRVVTAEPPPQQ